MRELVANGGAEREKRLAAAAVGSFERNDTMRRGRRLSGMLTRLMRVRISLLYCLLYSRFRALTRMGFVAAFGIMVMLALRC